MANVNLPQPVAQLGPQTDFASLRQGLRQVTTELGNLANLPPFTQGNALMQQMQQFQQQTQQFQQQMQQQFQQLQQSQQQMREQMTQNFTTVRNDIQTLRNDININYRAT
jgi:DNA anti-recombination protein RmuC